MRQPGSGFHSENSASLLPRARWLSPSLPIQAVLCYNLRFSKFGTGNKSAP
jgi:hypothetical protein